ncbi:RNB domain-containing ribonuclease [Cyanobacterium stanieri LEGE 03274]|uniref:RNB domain-containing ribonuclease n=1 Tax=Cyanobacterium stanieri LEGE 03274 TaxID=1828756 RepID=A0ABR9V695_9CHRO|nr:RNB domain-containing ribonuclease [Cyanobacterium stanieri]MBE9223408.1 RNB domain-containing ribonuclease [Cyanobacterium stanieri LEGE 03274]
MKSSITPRKFSYEQVNQASNVNLVEKINLARQQRPCVFGITIDDATTVDRDDAIWLIELDNNQFELQISITDVGALIPKNSPIDQEALKRVITLYHTNPNTPMLPVHISTNLGSLEEGKERLALTIFFTLDSQGNIIKFEIQETIFKNLRAFSYEEVENILKNPTTKKHDQLLVTIQKITQVLASQRKGKSGILTDDGYIDEDGNLIAENVNTHQLIAELMILTNTTIARLLAQEKIPALFRTQDVGIQDLDQAIKEMGHCLVPAIYSPCPLQHVGLALETYSHFTSPLRRFVDLVNHRIIKAYINKKSSPYNLDELQVIADYINDFHCQFKEDKSLYLSIKRKVDIANKYDHIKEQEIRSLSRDDFSELLEYFTSKKRLPELRIYIQERLNTLSLKDFYFIWFVARIDDFFYLDNLDTISILLIASQIKNITVNYEVKYNQKHKTYRAKCFINGLTTADFAEDVKKVKAKQTSALMAIKAYVNNQLVKDNKSKVLVNNAHRGEDKNVTAEENFSALLHEKIDSNSLTNDFLMEVEKKIDYLQPKDFYKLWFVAKINSFFGQQIDAVSVLLVRSQLDHVKVEYKIDKYPQQEGYYSFCYVDGLTTMHPAIDKKKSKAKQKSALNYIKAFLENNLTNSPQNPTIEDIKTEENHPSSPPIKSTVEKDYISLIHDLCQTNQMDYPEYKFIKIDNFFQCLITLNYRNKTIKSTGYGKSKKQAKQCASHVMMIQHNLHRSPE